MPSSFIVFESKKMRTIVDLPDEQIKALKRVAEHSHLSRAELIRRAVAQYLTRHQPVRDDDAFGLWKARQEDGLKYQESVRAEWDR
jgi:predicted transcriptional regulator